MVAQFYSIENKVAYADGWPFPEDSEYPDGEWVKVISRSRVGIRTLARKAKEIVSECGE